MARKPCSIRELQFKGKTEGKQNLQVLIKNVMMESKDLTNPALLSCSLSSLPFLLESKVHYSLSVHILNTVDLCPSACSSLFA